MICPVCQSDNPDGNAYCGKCGAGLNSHENTTPIYRAQSSSVRRETVIVLIGILAIFAALASTYYLFFVPRSPQYAVRKFIEADLSGNMADQTRYISTRWDSRMLLSTFQTIRQSSGTSPFKNYSILNSSEQSDSASVIVRIPIPPPAVGAVKPAAPPRAIFPNNSVDVIFHLVREENDWRIDPATTVASLSGVLLALGLSQVPVPGNALIPLPGMPPPPAAATPMPTSPPPRAGI